MWGSLLAVPVAGQIDTVSPRGAYRFTDMTRTPPVLRHHVIGSATAGSVRSIGTMTTNTV